MANEKDSVSGKSHDDVMQQGAVIEPETVVYFYHPNQVGSTTHITDGSGEVYQHLEYFPFGETFVEERSNALNDELSYQFSGKEKDEETGMYYYGARYYDPMTSMWLGVDPLADKYPNESPYVYAGNNPLNTIDPNGKEKVVIVGAEYSDYQKRYPYNFIEPGIKAIKELPKNESRTLIVANAGYSKKDLAEFQKIAEREGAAFQLINSQEELTNYLNSQDVSISGISDSRKADRITGISVFSHGQPGEVSLAYHQEEDIAYALTWDISAIRNLNPDAFNNPSSEFYSCNSATPTNPKGTGAFVNTFMSRVGGSGTGFWGKTDYSGINRNDTWLSRTARLLGRRFNPNGSVNYPTEGTTKGQYNSGNIKLTYKR